MAPLDDVMPALTRAACFSFSHSIPLRLLPPPRPAPLAPPVSQTYPAVFLTDNTSMITLWQAAAGAAAHDRRSAAGLHHLALRVAGGDAALDGLEATLRAAAGVEVVFGAQELKGFGVRHMMVTAAGVRIEFIAA